MPTADETNDDPNRYDPFSANGTCRTDRRGAGSSRVAPEAVAPVIFRTGTQDAPTS
jgi:hypothetical protein